MLLRIVRIAFALGAVMSIGNGLWMLILPDFWYASIPELDDFGPFNLHFVRDIGCAYLATGAGMAFGALSPQRGLWAARICVAFHTAHGLLHVYDGLTGTVGPEHWLLELPSVFLPALLLTAAAVVKVKT